jgi:hypothetical protein
MVLGHSPDRNSFDIRFKATRLRPGSGETATKGHPKFEPIKNMT